MERYRAARVRIAAVLRHKSTTIKTKTKQITLKIQDKKKPSTNKCKTKNQSQNARKITTNQSKTIREQKNSTNPVLGKFIEPSLHKSNPYH